MPMNIEIKKKWLDALRGGEYQQGRQALKVNGDFCCLGVLCDLYRKEVGGAWGSTGDFIANDHDVHASILPAVVRDWAGLTNSNPNACTSAGESRQIASLNDRGYTFAQLADIIEREF